MIDLETLNPPQKDAVTTTEGPVLVLAGAGSGKTKALTYRIAYILDSGLAGPNNILAMTFTNKAAGEMKERISKLLTDSSAWVNKSEVEGKDEEEGQGEVGAYMNSIYGSVPRLLWMGTFHSVCVKILKIYGEHVGISRNFSIYDSSDQNSAVKEAMNRLNISIKEFNPNAVHNYISSAKNELVSPQDYELYAQGYFQQVVARIYPEYQKVLRENNAVDFDDLIFLAIKLFRENKVILEKFQKQFKYILVDEYQDTNHAQYTFIRLLAEHYKNICCVGDDDQSIYAFRGATIKNILTFEKDYPDAKVIKLEQNYRSTKKILEASHQVISKNIRRKDKKLWTENIDGDNITIYTARNETDEGKWVTDTINSLNENLSDIAILYRTNAQSRTMEEAFLEAGVPYRIVGGVRFYERREIKDVLAYIKLIFNPKDNKNLERIINVPKRGIGLKTYADLDSQARIKAKSIAEYLMENSDEINSKIKDFAFLLTNLTVKSKTLNIVDFINYLLDATGYIKSLKDGTLENESRIENIKELISVASKFEGEDPLVGLDLFLQEVSLLEGNVETSEVKDRVTLMTIHAAKGLEFKHVFVVGVEENLFPHANTMLDERELEEERRLAYVAITRAKEKLYLTHAKQRIYFGVSQSNPLSRFAMDIDSDLVNYLPNERFESFDTDFDDSYFKQIVNFEIGDRVEHEYFGKGTVRYMDDEMIHVDFGAVYGVKELMLEYAKLKKVNN